MNLDRLEFSNMISFIKPVIPDSEDDGKNYLFVRLENDNVIFTGGNKHAIKKVVMINNPDIEKHTKAKPPKTFMIPKATLESFKTLMDKHKAKCKKLSKDDVGHLYIDINHEELYSHGVAIHYQQPSSPFKNMEADFEHNQAPATNIFIYPGDISSVMAGFSNSKQVKTVFSGEDNCPIHYIQGDYEAVYIPPPEENPEPPMMGGDE